MIREILGTQGVGVKKTVVQRKGVDNTRVTDGSALNVGSTKYSSNHLKANFLFQKASSKVSFGSSEFPIVPLNNSSVSKNITELPLHELHKGHYYDELANDVAIMIGPGKNTLLTNEEGVSTDLLVHNFTRNLLDKKYVHDGFHPFNTDVYTFDAEKSGNMFPLEEVNRIAAKNPNKKKVIFVENFHIFIATLKMQGKDPQTVLSEGGINKNVQLVGIMPKNIYNAIMEGQVPSISPKLLKPLNKTEFDGLSAADTKDLLKKDARYTSNILKRYKELDMKISYNAIDTLVDKSAATVDGCFPAKALRVLDLAAASKAIELKSHKAGKVLPITVSDVKRFFENHTGITSGLKPAQGQFRMAENIKTKMADVGGISTIKEEINDDILAYLKNPKKFVESGREIPTGKLLYGPPGNGKTLLARAIAGETGVPFISAAGSEFVEKYVGVGAQRMRELFDNARKAAAASEKHMAIVFIDEIDAFAKTRGSGGESESEKTLNQLLTEMDGFDKHSKNKIFVLAATNRKEMLDPALLRFGRLDGGIEIPNPKMHSDRLEILNIHTRKKPFASDAEKTRVLNKAAEMTDGMSGSDIAGVIQEATKAVAKRDDNKFITEQDIQQGCLKILETKKPSDSQFRVAENIKTKLSEVGGISTIKEEINDDVLAYLQDPKKFAESGREIPSGKLLYGPPGNGKTLLARAIAGEAGVPFISASGSEFVEKYVGTGAQRMRELFDTARKAAAANEKKIAIVFIDEIDAFAKARGASGSGGGESESEKTLNQLLTEMDGFNKNAKVKVFVLAATNRKDIIDPALLRFGRFDGGIEVTNPRTVQDRLEILSVHARNKPFASEAEKTKILNSAAKITEGMSGADLAGLMAKTAKVVSKRADNQIITYNDMIEGYLQVIAGPIKKSDLSIEDKKMVVRHEAGHAVVLDTLKQDKISFITLDGRGDFLGAVFHGERKEMPNFKSVIYSAATSYAGGHAEPGFETKGHGAGVSGDLKNATNLIERAIKKWGLGVHTPQISIGEESSNQATNLLNMYKNEIKEDINLFTKTAQTVSRKVVDFHQEFLDEYMKKYEDNAGKGGNNLSGEEFSKMREDWITKTGRTKQYKVLQKEIEQIVEVAQNGKVGFLKKILKAIR